MSVNVVLLINTYHKKFYVYKTDLKSFCFEAFDTDSNDSQVFNGTRFNLLLKVFVSTF